MRASSVMAVSFVCLAPYPSHPFRPLGSFPRSKPQARLFTDLLPPRLACAHDDGPPASFLSDLGGPRFIAAPMVGHSDLAFRLLVRRHGVDLCYTQMLHSAKFLNDPKFNRENFDPMPAEAVRDVEAALASFGPRTGTSTMASAPSPSSPRCTLDSPLIAQFCGNDPVVVVGAASLVQADVDAVDFNLGCPQRIAKKGNYGAFLMRQPEKVHAVVSAMAKELEVPVTAKIRVVEAGVAATVEFAKMLEDAGAAAVTVHGRTLKQNKQHCGTADWGAIAAVVDALSIPVIANGGIETARDALRCLAITGASAVMSSEALLENPALFSPCAYSEEHPPADALPYDPSTERERVTDAHTAQLVAASQLAFAREYLVLASVLPPRDFVATIKGHLFKFLHRLLEPNTDLRDTLVGIENLEDAWRLVDGLAHRYALPASTECTVEELRQAPLEESVRRRARTSTAMDGAPLEVSRSWYRRHWPVDAETPGNVVETGSAQTERAMKVSA